jgi:predicted membrane chloride channel (bestrophin family)
MVEAGQVWTAIASASRYWGMISRDFPTNPKSTRTLVHRHLAWLTVLRYQLRGRRVWESVTSSSNTEYREKFYTVPESESPLEVELAKYLPEDELEQLTAATNKAGWPIGAQIGTIKDLFASQELAGPYVSLDQVGESTENPFEGGANDVPISQISRLVEIDLREMLGETDLPRLLRPKNEIIL